MGKIAELVDKGYELDSTIKKLKKELDEIKKLVKSHAKKYKQREVVGSKSMAVVSDTGYTTADPQLLYDHLDEQGREHEFWSLVNVKITDAKKLLGETGMSVIGESGSIPFNKISFKKQ